MTTYDTNATAAAIDSPTLTICKYFWSKAKEAYPELANQENNGEPPYNIVPIFPISVAKNTSNFSWDTNNVLITYDDFKIKFAKNWSSSTGNRVVDRILERYQKPILPGVF